MIAREIASIADTLFESRRSKKPMDVVGPLAR